MAEPEKLVKLTKNSTWVVTFRCNMHKCDLEGDPIWYYDDVRNVYWPDASYMGCPKWAPDDDSEVTCVETWEIAGFEVVKE